MVLYRDLSWLPLCPADFKKRCRTAFESAGSFGSEIRLLAQFALDDNQLIHLAKTISAGREKGHSFAPLAPFRLGLACNGTSEFIRDCVTATGARYGLALNGIATGYDQVLQDSLSPESPLNRAAPDAVLIAVDWRGLQLQPSPGNAAAAQSAIESALNYLDTIRDAIHRNCGAVCIVQNLAAPPEPLFGSLDRKLHGTCVSL